MVDLNERVDLRKSFSGFLYDMTLVLVSALQRFVPRQAKCQTHNTEI